jgi:energy-coupling factor transporter ATP-binding protein EcfA2
MKDELINWFDSRPLWIKKALEVVIEQKEITNDVIDELVFICKEEVKGNFLASNTVDLNVVNLNTKYTKINLLSIEDFKGINAIAPNQKIEFHNENLTIIFGQNGTGKSSYVRTLKHACGAKNPGKLHNNIYKNSSSVQECTINIKVNEHPKTIIWGKHKGLDEDLRHLHIYDTNAATAYVNEKNEVEYEPFLLQLFSSIINLCGEVKLKIDKEKESKEITLKRPKLPSRFATTSIGKWYENLAAENTQMEIIDNLNWDVGNERRLLILNKDLTKEEISKNRKEISKKKNEICNIKRYLTRIYESVSDEKNEEYLVLYREIERKKDLILNDAEKIFSDSELDGVATESWKLMWKYAREYSENHAYPHLEFPNIRDNARCVLCQQELEDITKKRLSSFYGYITSTLQKDLESNKKQIDRIEDSYPVFDKEETLLLRLRSIGLDESQPLYNEINEFHNNLFKRKKYLIESKENIYFGEIFIEQVLLNLNDLIEYYTSEDEELKILEEDTNENKEIEKINLECKKWLSEHKEVIQNDLNILKDIFLLEQSKNLTKTTSFSNKKSELSEMLVTEAYINRFNQELKRLCNRKIKVKLVKDSTSRGRVFHKVILEKPTDKVNILEILSEGEFRMVSLAAFLANVESESRINSPFIFDDPISSLDQTYEESTVKRLVELTKYRQVIVFTHRLSLCSLIEEELKKEGLKCKFINLKRNSNGTGIPTESPFVTQGPLKALNALVNEKILSARKIEDEDYSLYELVVGGICKQVRITTEHIIENHLINQVVKRYRRSITTKNRMQSLALITVEDCHYLDEVMTKFSIYEHSQPDEAPAILPNLDELEVDIKKLKSWLENFLERQKQYEKEGLNKSTISSLR